MNEYNPFSNALSGFDFDHVLPALHETGEIRPGLLTTMTQDLLAKRIAGLRKQHPMFKTALDAEKAEHVAVGVARMMFSFLQEYFELKDTHPDLRISECSVSVSKHLERFKESFQIFDEDAVDVGVLRRVLPSLLEEAYKEAKNTIATISKERAPIRAKA